MRQGFRAAPRQQPFAVPLRHQGIQRAAGVFPNQLLDAGQAGVIVRMQVDAENARQEDAVSHLQPAQLHVADQFTDNRLAADAGLRRVSAVLRHSYTNP